MSATINAGKWRSEVQKMADRARDAGDYLAAAELYEKVISLGGPSSIAMAAGHMRKEAKDFVAAERHYQNVRATNPDDPEIYMQLGHFYKTVGRYGDAQRHYMQALQKHYPNFDEVKHELRAIHESKELLREQERRDTLEGAKFKGLVAERLLPRKLEQIQRDYHETFILSRLGSHSKTRWGKGRTVRGVDAVRGHVITSMPCDSIDIFLDDELIYSESLQAVSLRWEKTVPIPIYVNMSSMPGLISVNFLSGSTKSSYVRTHFRVSRVKASSGDVRQSSSPSVCRRTLESIVLPLFRRWIPNHH